MEGGALAAVSDAARRRGTTVSVNDLFYNVPARLKFLRGARSEWRAVMDVLTTMALTRRDTALLVMPMCHGNSLFFFGAQEWVNFFQTQTNTATVPTALMRNGDFSELLSPTNGFYSTAQIIRDPLTGQPFAGNIIPSSRFNPTAVGMLPLFLALRRFDAAFLVFILGMIASFSSMSPSEALQHYAAILGAPAGAGVPVASATAGFAVAVAAGFGAAGFATGVSRPINDLSSPNSSS